MKTLTEITEKLCGIIDCEECPVYIFDYEKRTDREKCNLQVPCCINLERWIRDMSLEEM